MMPCETSTTHEVVEQGGGAQSEPLGIHPVGAEKCMGQLQVVKSVLGGSNTARGFHANLAPGTLAELAD